MTNYTPVLGFEVHLELDTRSKMFCGCPADHFGKPPNTQTCPVCLGLPGALPVPNSQAIEWCIKVGLALNCQINLFSKFDRKNYFYPDLPKGYQISQYDLPFCHSGSLILPSGKTVRITRVHMEEDTGKLQHAVVDGQKVTLIDFNRSGVPLVEIVTEPDFDRPDDGIEFLKEIQQIIRALGVSTGDLEKGSMRLEANISVKKPGQTALPDYKIEVKNVNSFRFIKKAIEYEINRQIDILKSGQLPPQETRGFNETKGVTFSQRSKEDAHDYRYFPEPDIPPLRFTKSQIETWRSQLPELPSETRAKLENSGLPKAAAATIVSAPARLKKYLELLAVHPSEHLAVAKLVANAPEESLPSLSLSPISINSNESQIRDTLKEVISQNPKAVADIKAGKDQVKFFLIGQVKKQLGEIDIPLTQKLLSVLLK